MEVTGKVKKMGSEIGIMIPEKMLEELNLEEGDIVEAVITKKEKIDGFSIFAGAKPFQEEKEHTDLW